VEGQSKWQPVMLVMSKRLECQCGSLAIFVVLDGNEKRGDKEDMDYSAWCQECWAKEQDEC